MLQPQLAAVYVQVSMIGKSPELQSPACRREQQSLTLLRFAPWCPVCADSSRTMCSRLLMGRERGIELAEVSAAVEIEWAVTGPRECFKGSRSRRQTLIKSRRSLKNELMLPAFPTKQRLEVVETLCLVWEDQIRRSDNQQKQDLQCCVVCCSRQTPPDATLPETEERTVETFFFPLIGS